MNDIVFFRWPFRIYLRGLIISLSFGALAYNVCYPGSPIFQILFGQVFLFTTETIIQIAASGILQVGAEGGYDRKFVAKFFRSKWNAQKVFYTIVIISGIMGIYISILCVRLIHKCGGLSPF